MTVQIDFLKCTAHKSWSWNYVIGLKNADKCQKPEGKVIQFLLQLEKSHASDKYLCTVKHYLNRSKT